MGRRGLVERLIDAYLVVRRAVARRNLDRRRMGAHHRRPAVSALVVSSVVLGPLERCRLGHCPLVLGPLVVSSVVLGPLVVCSVVLASVVGRWLVNQ
jgi:hypothetical protein